MQKLILDNSWTFNRNVSVNFDEHVIQSIPNYQQLQKNIARIARHFIKKNCYVYDIGCSTGNTIVEILKLNLNLNFTIIGIDKSPNMINVAKSKFNKKYHQKIHLRKKNFLKSNYKNKANVIIASLIIPFLNDSEKKNFFIKAYKLLNNNGTLILIDKIKSKVSDNQEVFKSLYDDFKLDKGLSKKHIIDKSKSILTSMTIYDLDELSDLIKNSQFKSSEIFYRMYNFVGFIIRK